MASYKAELPPSGHIGQELSSFVILRMTPRRKHWARVAFLPMVDQGHTTTTTDYLNFSAHQVINNIQFVNLPISDESAPPTNTHTTTLPHYHSSASALKTLFKSNTVALNGMCKPNPLLSNVSPP